MPGYNHRPDCQCGWCKGGRTTYNAPRGSIIKQLDYNYRTSEAAREALKKLKVSSYSSCFVDPNAKCPVCGQAVFFYSNIYGSRVYFNELGPPWEKHHCTDNSDFFPRQSPTKLNSPTTRSKSQIQYIANTVRVAGSSFATKIFTAGNSKWVLCVVLQVLREGSKVIVEVETLSPANNVKSKFVIYCDENIIDEGDVVSNKGHRYSFLHKNTLQIVKAVDGDVFGKLSSPNPDASRKEIPEDLAEMEPSENRHFHSSTMSKKAIADKYTSILKDFSERRIIGPKIVSHYLNEIGHKTASGEIWTPRLVFFLIKILGAPMEKSQNRSSIKSVSNKGGLLKKKRSKSWRSKKK
jgi:hypothetical protein